LVEVLENGIGAITRRVGEWRVAVVGATRDVATAAVELMAAASPSEVAVNHST